MLKQAPYSYQLGCLEQGHRVITANRRTQQAVVKAWDSHQLANSEQIWQTAKIQTLTDWVKSLWQNYQDRGHPQCYNQLLLNESDENILWQRAAKQEFPHRDFTTMAKDAANAYETLLLWEIDLDSEQIRNYFYGNEDEKVFLEWCDNFRQLCRQQNYVTFAEIVSRLSHLAAQNPPEDDTPIDLFGFQDIPPCHKTLLECATTKWQWHKVHPSNPLISIENYPDFEAEIYHATRWAKDLFIQSPEKHIGIVVHDLMQRRAQVEHTLRLAFNVTSMLPENTGTDIPVNFSAGQPLATLPIIDSALQILAFNLPEDDMEDIDITELTGWLYSPYWGDSSCQQQCAHLVSHIRKRGLRYISRQQLLQLCKPIRSSSGNSKSAKKAFDFFISAYKNSVMPKKSMYPYDWAKTFSNVLKNFHWPPVSSLSSKEFQGCKRWQEVLEEFSCQSQLLGKLKAKPAVRQLSQLLHRRIFQQQHKGQAVQVLGQLEAGGLDFDHLWVTGMDDKHWPQMPQPSVFIPLALQKQKQMRGADASRELVFSRRLLNDYCHSSKEVVLSFSRMNGEQACQSSPLLEELNIDEKFISLEVLPKWDFYPKQQLELLDPGRVPLDTDSFSGGSGVLKDQVDCPFKAFAVHRLKARQPTPISTSYNIFGHGTLVHRVLEKIWLSLQNLTQLKERQEAATLLPLIEQCVEQAIEENPHQWRGVLAQVEKERVVKLIQQWLELESLRPDFKIHALEQQHRFDIDGLQLRLTIDRIDNCDGKFLVIDYKTGKANVRGWLKEHLEEPQLPLYAAAVSSDGVAFATIKEGNLGFAGLTNFQSDIEGISMDALGKTSVTWQEIFQAWQTNLKILADEFKTGEASVTPRAVNTCRYCHLKGVCRVGDS